MTLTDEKVDELLGELRATRAELRKLRSGELVAHLSEAEREEIAYRVFERLEARLAPHDPAGHDASPHRAAKRGFFRG